ncbi:copper-containing nitrite reductase [uncultured Nitrospira sp.]|uniref:copper-containing nitrite reductase n=1 Tax=uncultured Nitrospira sp. TaxID=157176 RepID=UPI00314076A4
MMHVAFTHTSRLTGFISLATMLGVLAMGTVLPAPAMSMPTIQAQLTTLPQVPTPITRKEAAHVVVHVEAKEYVGTLADGVQYKFWSFNGTVPGPMIRVRQGDTVEVHLKNHADSIFPHNMDLHAVNGPGGGAGSNLAIPGKEGMFSFKALVPGLYIYHCASPVPNIPAHIANGMYGLILVDPAEGLTPVDKEYAVLQSEFFTMPSAENGIMELSMEKGLAEHPDHVVLNGRAGALIGEGQLEAKAGDIIRLYVGNIGPNSASSFHIIGEIFDKVYVEGAIGGTVNKNVQTTLIPSAGSVIVEFKVDVPGAYLLVDHSIFRVAKGAVGILSVTGEDNSSIYNSMDPAN